MPVAKVYNSNTGQWEPVLVGDTGPAGADATLTKSIRTETADTTLLAADANQIVRFNGTSAQTLTVPDVLSVGQRVEIVQDNSGSVQLASGSGVTLLSTTGGFELTGQNAKTELVCVAAGEYRLYGDVATVALDVEYLVIAGGGGGGSNGDNFPAAGAGAGGYQESTFEFEVNNNYSVTVGAGGAAIPPSGNQGFRGNQGSNSVFDTFTSTGGGGGAGGGSSTTSTDVNGGDGGSGGGSGLNNGGVGIAGTGTQSPGFGNDGGVHQGTSGDRVGGGGGGAGAAGDDGIDGGNGGNGRSSTITGSSVTRAGGGGAGAQTGSAGTGSAGGGDGGLFDNPGTNATANTGSGGGGGGGSSNPQDGGNGGSGVVILRYPALYTITIGAGLTGTETTVGDDKVATITAGTGNVSWS